MPEQPPPGRAGRLWLRARLESTRRGAELLDRKRQLLRHELTDLATRREATSRAWTAACEDAQRWGVRAAALGGALDVTLATLSVGGRSRVEVLWRNTMGVLHPGEARAELAELSPAAAAAGNAAIGPAAAAYRRALEAAADHAAVEASYALLAAELRATERRARAIERHRIPLLERSLSDLELRLEELEREERVVGRWAKQRRDVAQSSTLASGLG